jgi:type IX secretion system substrate protein
MKRNFTLLKRGYLNLFILASLCTFINLQKANAQVCASANNIFGMDANGNIYMINVTTGAAGSKINATAYTTSGNQANAIGYNIVNSTFYYFQVNPGAGGTQKFISYNTVTNTYATLAASPTTATVHAGCVNFSGTGYYCSDVNGSLYYYNITTNTWITITTKIVDQSATNVSTIIQTQNSGDMAIDGYNNLWLITSSASNFGLYKIPAASLTSVQASVTASRIIAPTTSTPNGNAFEGIAFNSSGQIYMAAGDGGFYKLNTASTALVHIGTLSDNSLSNDLASCSYPFSILSVSWASFSVSMNSNDNVSVNWSVEDASDVKGFYVERSNDDENWQQLSYVDFAQNQSNYSFTDANPLQGNNYYRIHEVDYNNDESYSEIKMIAVASSDTKIAVWPNPARGVVNIQNNSADNNLKAQVFDAFGRMVTGVNIHQGSNSVNISSLPSGTYVMHVEGNNGVAYNEKIIKR